MLLVDLLKEVKPGVPFRRSVWGNKTFALFVNTDGEICQFDSNGYATGQKDHGFTLASLIADDWYIMQEKRQNELINGELIIKDKREYVFVNDKFYENKPVELKSPVHLV